MSCPCGCGCPGCDCRCISNPSAVDRAKDRVKKAKGAKREAEQRAAQNAFQRTKNKMALTRWTNALKALKKAREAYFKIKQNRKRGGENSWPEDKSTGFLGIGAFATNGRHEWERWHRNLKIVLKPPYKAPAGKRWTKEEGHYTWHLVER